MRRLHMWTYLVGWPDELIIKAGVTTNRRWRMFCTRGAKLYMLHLASDSSRGRAICDLETSVEGALASRFDLAFATKDDGKPFLGSGGAGYLECYRAPSRGAYLDALARCRRIMREHPGGGSCGLDMHALMHERTDARTYGEPHSPTRPPLVSDAHAHIREMAVDKWGDR